MHSLAHRLYIYKIPSLYILMYLYYNIFNMMVSQVEIVFESKGINFK